MFDSSQTVTFSGGIGEGVFNGASLTKVGPGTLALTGVNNYSGSTVIGQGGGTLDLGSSGTLLDSSNITIGDQGTLKLDNSLAYLSSRISPLAAIALAGGTLDFVGAANTTTNEAIGAVTLVAGHTSTIESDQGQRRHGSTDARFAGYGQRRDGQLRRDRQRALDDRRESNRYRDLARQLDQRHSALCHRGRPCDPRFCNLHGQ